jgi:ParB-like chromosome segregation protein Spo0J
MQRLLSSLLYTNVSFDIACYRHDNILGPGDGKSKSAVMPEKVVQVRIDEIAVGEPRRSIDNKKVKELAESLSEIGLKSPVTVRTREDGQGVELVVGRHRLLAAKQLGWDIIDARLMDGDSTDARLWQIAENLHRTDLTPLERAEQTTEWVKLREQKKVVSGQDVQKRKGGRPQGGIADAARKLPVPGRTPEARRKSIERSRQIAGISDEAKSEARKTEIDNNMAALLTVSKETTREAQVKKVQELASDKRARSGNREKRRGVGGHRQPADQVDEPQREVDEVDPRVALSRFKEAVDRFLPNSDYEAKRDAVKYLRQQVFNKLTEEEVQQAWEEHRFAKAPAERSLGMPSGSFDRLVEKFGLRRPWGDSEKA